MNSNLDTLKMIELSRNEMIHINGGGSGFTVLGRILGLIASICEDWSYTSEGKAAQQALRDFQ